MDPFMGFPFDLQFDQIEQVVFVPENEEEVLNGILDMQEEQHIQMREDAALAELLRDDDDEDDGYCSDYVPDEDMEEVFDAQVEDMEVFDAQVEDMEVFDAHVEDMEVFEAQVEDMEVFDAQVEDMEVFDAQFEDMEVFEAQVEDMEVFDAQVEEEEEDDHPAAAAAVDSDAETVENVRDVDLRDLDYHPEDGRSGEDEEEEEEDDTEEEEMEIEVVEEHIRLEVAVRQVLKAQQNVYNSAKDLLRSHFKSERAKLVKRLHPVQRRIRKNRHRLTDVHCRHRDMSFGCGKPFWLQRTRSWIRCAACGDWLCPDCNQEPVHCQDEEGLFNL